MNTALIIKKLRFFSTYIPERERRRQKYRFPIFRGKSSLNLPMDYYNILLEFTTTWHG